MATPRHSNDEQDNTRIWRWLVIAVVVLAVGAVVYNLLGPDGENRSTAHQSKPAPSAAPVQPPGARARPDTPSNPGVPAGK